MTKKTHLFILITIVLFLLGCSANQAIVNHDAEAVSAVSHEPTEYVIQPGDQLGVKFFYKPELNETIPVRPDGKISLQLIDEVQAAGLTPAQLDTSLTQKYAQELKKPDLTVIVRSFSGQRVYVEGEVNRPGLLNLTTGMSVLEAVINAGGLKETAKPEATIVIRKGPDNRPVPIRVDLAKTLYGQSDAPIQQLMPHDIIYVPKSFIAKANKFVNQYIEQLLLFRGVNFGFSYEVHDAGASN